MIRVYLDSNVFRYIKPSHPYYNKELHDLIDKLKDEVIFIYSGAHLDDLKDSAVKYRNDDLFLMGNYVKDHFFFRDPIKKVTSCSQIRPLEAYSGFDYEAFDNSLNNPFDLKELFKGLDDNEDGGSIRKLIENIFNQPLSKLGETLSPPRKEDPSREIFDRMFPGYNPDMSLKDFLSSISPFTSKLMRGWKEVSEIRNYLKSYVDRKSYSFDRWGMGFNNKLKEKFGKTFLEMVDGMILENQKNDFYIRFNYVYTLLEMFNVTQERSGKRNKKFTYWSLYRDSDHCYFASMCDYLVTDDKGFHLKATIAYNLLGIETKILSTKDFIEHKSRFFCNENTFDEFQNNFVYNIENSELYSIESVIESRDVISSYKLKRVLFGFFDHMHFIDYNHKKFRTCVLSFRRKYNDNIIAFMYSEIESVVNKFTRVFGKDYKNRENYVIGENFSSGEVIRAWVSEQVEVQLTFREEVGWIFVEAYIHIEIKPDLSNI